MKTFVFILIVFYVQVEAFPSIFKQRAKPWDDAMDRLLELEAKVQNVTAGVHRRVKEAEQDFYVRQEIYSSKLRKSISDVVVSCGQKIDEWKFKAEEKNINIEDCLIQYRDPMEDVLPDDAVENVTSCWTENFVWNQLRADFKYLTRIPNRVSYLQNSLQNCKEDNINCINKSLKDIDNGFEDIPKEMLEYEQRVLSLINTLFMVLERCIEVNFEKFKVADEQLTKDAIQCIQDLINKEKKLN